MTNVNCFTMTNTRTSVEVGPINENTRKRIMKIHSKCNITYRSSHSHLTPTEKQPCLHSWWEAYLTILSSLAICWIYSLEIRIQCACDQNWRTFQTIICNHNVKVLTWRQRQKSVNSCGFVCNCERCNAKSNPNSRS